MARSDIDWRGTWLGGDGSVGTHREQLTHTHGSARWKDQDVVVVGKNKKSARRRSISETSSTLSVCCAVRYLQQELQAYLEIVEQSEHLHATDTRKTYQLSWDRCHVTDWVELEQRCHNISSI